MHESAPDPHAEEAVLHLLSRGLISHPSATEMRQLSSRMALQRFERGQDVVREGDMGDALFILVEGSLEVLIDSPSGLRVVSRVGAGEIIGAQAITGWFPRRRSATVRALESSLLARLDRATFRAFCDQSVTDGIAKLGRMHAMGRLRALSPAIAATPESTLLSLPWDQLDLLRGGDVYAAGSVSDRAFFIVQGTVEILPISGGNPVTRGKGDAFGHHGIEEEAIRHEAAIAGPNTVLISMPARTWRRLNKEGLQEDDTARSSHNAPIASARGSITIRHIDGDDDHPPAIVCEYDLPDGRKAAGVRVPETAGFRLSIIDAAPGRTHRFSAPAPKQRAVAVMPDGRIHDILSVGPWAALPELCARLLDGIALTTSDLDMLHKGGRLPTSGTEICPCAAVTRQALIAGFLEGAITPLGIEARTGAGSVCGGCAVSISNTIAEYHGSQS